LATETKAARFKQVEKLSAQLDKEHTDSAKGRVVTNSIIRLGDRPILRVPCTPTKLPTLDYDVLQYGGFPRGRVVEIFGPEGSGKTTIALHTVAQEQAEGGIAAYIDAEHKLEPTYAQALGVNIDDLLFNQPNSGEEALDTVDKLVESGAVNFIVIDSAAALVPEAELAGDIGDQHMGLQARMMSQALRILTGKATRTQTTLIFINQIREKIGVMYGNPETTPGGRALKFYSSVRLSVSRKEAIWEGNKENIVGHSIDLRCVKNGGGIPFRRTQINLIYPGKGRQPGFDRVNDMIDFAIGRNLLETRGSWFWMDLGSKEGVEKVANGAANLKVFLSSNEKAMEKLQKQVVALIKKEEETPVATKSTSVV